MLRREDWRRPVHDLDDEDAVGGREEGSEEARSGRVEDWMTRCESERVWYIIWRSIVLCVRV
jgi:hypothetical protein